ncbi:hypothetical protein ACFFMP_08380 [Pseudoroseomonas cervicalis]|uniref:Uncharacterized protein n=1 Tax=Pseudoroseomonas cervicalis ATCC 49957 TaxID=525371 RepID=D5RTE0_9PROT|nr:hypothetical protein [Pseudoroseomonas cervicalis]EFH09432.1 hypothetical protein HMPREF0731_4352 [Pseudoroseomonas cervicalis ATCC 49957]
MWTEPIYLRFADLADWDAARSDAPPGAAISVVGPIFERGEQVGTDESGEPVFAGRALPGWHVNLRLPAGAELPQAWTAAVITPKAPRRVWA